MKKTHIIFLAFWVSMIGCNHQKQEQRLFLYFMIYSLINYQDLTEVFTFASFLIKFYTTLHTNEFIFIPAPTEAKTRKSLELISWPFILLHRDKSSSVGIVATDELPSQEMVIG